MGFRWTTNFELGSSAVNPGGLRRHYVLDYVGGGWGEGGSYHASLME